MASTGNHYEKWKTGVRDFYSLFCRDTISLRVPELMGFVFVEYVCKVNDYRHADKIETLVHFLWLTTAVKSV